MGIVSRVDGKLAPENYDNCDFFEFQIVNTLEMNLDRMSIAPM